MKQMYFRSTAIYHMNYTENISVTVVPIF